MKSQIFNLNKIFYTNLFLGGKPVTVQMAGGGQKTLTLVQAPQNIQTTKVQQTASLTGNFIRFAKLQQT